MDRQLLCKTADRLEKTKSAEPIIGNSAYVVNNSLHCSMQPKRASFDIKLFLQLHRKLIRKAVIEKTFEQSLYQFSSHSAQNRRGFKGNLIPQHRFHCSVSQRQKRTRTQGSCKLPASTSLSNARNGEIGKTEQGRRTQGVMSSHTKPNMMYNLSLYRRNYRKPDVKNDKTCMKLIQNFSKTSDEFINQTQHSRTRKLQTII